MSTGLLNTIGGMAKEAVALPGRMLAQSRYRQSVFDGTMDEAVLTAARRIPAEWEADRRTYEARVEAKRVLDEDVPRLEEAAHFAAEALEAARGLATSPLPDSTTIGQLREKLATLTKVPTSTVADLSRAIQEAVADGPRRGGIGRLKSRLSEARQGALTAQQRAEQLLFQTAANPPADTTAAIASRQQIVRRQISERQETLTAEAQAAEVQKQCERAAKGELVPVQVGLPPSTSNAGIYRFLRTKLDRLLDLASGRQTAEKQNAADEAELSNLQAQLEQARRAYLDQVSDPVAMKWVD